jgi:hypothetical protein
VILSHFRRFIFLRTVKTAGTSVEIALSKFCGPQDILTELAAEDEAIRRRLGYRGPQNVEQANPAVPGYAQYSQHAPAWVIQRLHPAEWRDYFKFTIVRNPWDVAASAYYWLNRDAVKRPTFGEFLSSGDFPRYASQLHRFFAIDGKVAMDHVCRFERLAEDLEKVWARLALPLPLDLPRAKVGVREKHYRDLMTSDEAAIVARLFRFEIETFGYSF